MNPTNCLSKQVTNFQYIFDMYIMLKFLYKFVSYQNKDLRINSFDMHFQREISTLCCPFPLKLGFNELQTNVFKTTIANEFNVLNIFSISSDNHVALNSLKYQTTFVGIKRFNY